MGKKRSGLFFGIITGTLLGILFAPKKGKELRNAIKKERSMGGHGLDAVKNGFIGMGGEIKDTAEEVYENPEFQEHVDNVKSKTSKYAKKYKREAQKMADRLKKGCEDCGDEVKKKVKKKVSKAKVSAKKKATSSLKNAKSKAAKFTRKKISKKK